MALIRLLSALFLAVTLAACAVEKGGTPAEIAAIGYAAQDRPYVSVVTMVNIRSDRAAHSALIFLALFNS